MSLECFRRIKGNRILALDPLNIRLCGVSSSPVFAIGKHPFDLHLFSDVAPLPVVFYIVDGINLPADILSGSPDLTKNNVDIFFGDQMLRYRYRDIHVFSSDEVIPENVPKGPSTLGLSSRGITGLVSLDSHIW